METLAFRIKSMDFVCVSNAFADVLVGRYCV